MALAAGAHVLVEKPAAISSAQVDRLIERQRASGRLVKVGFNHRFHPGLARVAEEVAVRAPWRAHAPARPLRTRRTPRL